MNHNHVLFFPLQPQVFNSVGGGVYLKLAGCILFYLISRKHLTDFLEGGGGGLEEVFSFNCITFFDKLNVNIKKKTCL